MWPGNLFRGFFGFWISPLKSFSVFDLFLRRTFDEDSGMSWGGVELCPLGLNNPGRQGEDGVEAGWKGDGDSDILVSRSLWMLLRRLDQLGPVSFLFSSPLSFVETGSGVCGFCSTSMSIMCSERREGVDEEEDAKGR